MFSGEGAFEISKVLATCNPMSCSRGGAGGGSLSPSGLGEGVSAGESLQRLSTASGNAYPPLAIAESGKTIIADFLSPERGQDGRGCYYRVLSGTTACLQEGRGPRSHCLVAPGTGAAPPPAAGSWAPCQDARGSRCWVDGSPGALASSHSCHPTTGPERASAAQDALWEGPRGSGLGSQCGRHCSPAMSSFSCAISGLSRFKIRVAAD